MTLPTGLHGVHLRSQLGDVLGPYGLRTAIKDGRLRPYSREVLVDMRVAATLTSRAAAAQLHAGADAVLTGFTALELAGCSAAPAGPIEILLPYHRGLRQRPGLRVHHGSITRQDVMDIAGLRVAVVDLALAEVLCRGRRVDAFACADQALAMVPQAERAELRATVAARIMERPDPRGRQQGSVLIELVTGQPESPPESWLYLGLFDAGLPLPECQYPIVGLDGREIYRLDFAWPEQRVVLEYDGYAAHLGRAHFDEVRAADLRRRGWTVIRATADDLRDPSRVVAQIRSALSARGVAA